MPAGVLQPPPIDWQARVRQQQQQVLRQEAPRGQGYADLLEMCIIRPTCLLTGVVLLLVGGCVVRLGGGNFGVTYEAIKLTVSLLAAAQAAAALALMHWP
jgi:hypothetical protein